MPVTGHLFAGLAAGVSAERSFKGFSGSRSPALSVSLVVLLAYLPDILANIFLISGWFSGRVFSHSVIGGVCVSLPVAALLGRAGFFSFRMAFGITLFSMLCHDLLDFFHSSDRRPFWPFSLAPSGFGLRSIFSNQYQEFCFYGALYCIFLLLFFIWLRKQEKPCLLLPFLKGEVSPVWGHRGITSLIIIAAMFTVVMREKREGQFREAKWALTKGRYNEALSTLTHAGSWPSTAKPGRLSYLKAQAYLGMGKERRAEELLLKSLKEEPYYFWCVLDLAMFYASSELPSPTRRRLAAPYVERLKMAEFSEIRGLTAYLKKLERKLDRPGRANG